MIANGWLVGRTKDRAFDIETCELSVLETNHVLKMWCCTGLHFANEVGEMIGCNHLMPSEEQVFCRTCRLQIYISTSSTQT